MNYIRLKSDLRENALQDRLQHNPEILEIHLEETDMVDTTRLIETIRKLKSLGITPYVHHPHKINGKFLDILSTNYEVRHYYHWSTKLLVEICKQEGIKCIIHAHYAETECTDMIGLSVTLELKREIEKILKYGRDVLLWENTMDGLFSSANPYLIPHLIEPLNLPLNVDISHAFIALRGDHDGFMEFLEKTEKFAEYYHVVDSMGKSHDGLPLGTGRIDWSRVKPLIHNKPFIFEINLKPPHDDCTAMIDSAKFYKNLK